MYFMLDSTVRTCADDDACSEFEAQKQDIEASLARLKSGHEAEPPKPHLIVSGLSMDHPAIWKLR
jgi:hypothetical protein